MPHATRKFTKKKNCVRNIRAISFRRDRRKSIDLDERSTPPKKPRGDDTPPPVLSVPPPYNHRELEIANCKENCRRSVSPEQDVPADLSSVKRSSRSPSPGRRFLDIKAEPLQLLCNNRDRIERSERGDDSPGSRDKVGCDSQRNRKKINTFYRIRIRRIARICRNLCAIGHSTTSVLTNCSPRLPLTSTWLPLALTKWVSSMRRLIVLMCSLGLCCCRSWAGDWTGRRRARGYISRYVTRGRMSSEYRSCGGGQLGLSPF